MGASRLRIKDVNCGRRAQGRTEESLVRIGRLVKSGLVGAGCGPPSVLLAWVEEVLPLALLVCETTLPMTPIGLVLLFVCGLTAPAILLGARRSMGLVVRVKGPVGDASIGDRSFFVSSIVSGGCSLLRPELLAADCLNCSSDVCI